MNGLSVSALIFFILLAALWSVVGAWLYLIAPSLPKRRLQRIVYRAAHGPLVWLFWWADIIFVWLGKIGEGIHNWLWKE